MDREKSFEEFLEECKNCREWSGQGNPNADILIIGKEPYNADMITDEVKIQEKLQTQEDICRSGYGEAPRNANNPTWYNYQKLIEEVYKNRREFNPELFDFEKYAFTTELNTIFRPKAVLDDKTRNNINERLLFFKESEFIKSFPVIVLACNNFISNDKKRGFFINNTFDVEFDGELKGWHKNKKGKPWFTTHHSKEKLVIHTWQFSLRFTTPEDREWLINEMASVIRDHLRKLGLF